MRCPHCGAPLKFGRKSRNAAGHDPGPASTAATADTGPFALPPLSLLSDPEVGESCTPDPAAEQARVEQLEEILSSFGVRAKVRRYICGPVVTRHEVELGPGVRISRVASLTDVLAFALQTVDVRVDRPPPGGRTFAIEVPKPERQVVGLRRVLESDAVRTAPSLLTVGLGRDVAGEPVVADLCRLPHLLVAGAGNSGRTTCLHAIVAGLVLRARPDQLQLVLIDPLRIDFWPWDGIPHLMAPIVHGVAHAVDVLRKLIREMEARYDRLARHGARNLREYNELAGALDEDPANALEPLPHIVVVIAELADLMLQARAELELLLCRIAQLGRAAGLHLVIATQRPSVNVITGLLKANVPSRIALTVASQHDSRAILGRPGAERLIGRGDMLFQPIEAGTPVRVHGALIEEADIERVAAYWRARGEPTVGIIPELPEDLSRHDEGADPSEALYEEAVRLVTTLREASVALLQRRLKLGFSRAARLIDLLEARGVVGPRQGARAREVLVPPGSEP